jgi:hypothetical protein
MPQSNFRLLKSARDACVARKVECDHGSLGMYRLRSQQNGFRSNIVLLYPGQRRNIMAQVFISYSRKDELFAQRLAEALAEQKRECWLDRKDIEFTADWKQRVLRGIEGVNAFVCVVSPDYSASTVCREEAEHAMAHNKRLVPLLRRPVDFSALHPAIAAINALPFAESDDFDAGVSKLIEALDTDFEWLDQHTRLLRRALEWDGKARDKSLILHGNDLRAAEQWLTQAGSARERNPTQLQTEYILTSRRASNHRLRVFLGIAVAVIVITIVLAAVATYQRGIARNERARAEQRTREVSQSLSRSDFLEATRRLTAYETGAALAHLARALRIDPGNSVAQRRLVSLLSQRDWQFPALEPFVHSDGVWSADFSPDGERIVTTSGAGFEASVVQLWNAETGERIGEALSGPSPVTASFNSDGSRIAVMWDLNVGEARTSSRCQMLDGVTGRPIAGPAEHAGTLRASAFSSDGKRLLLGYNLGNGAGEVCSWDATADGPLQTLLSFKDAVPQAFDAAGTRLITLGHESSAGTEEAWRIARVWNLRTGKPITTAFKHDEDLDGAIFSPDGDQIATHSKGRAFVWNLAADRLIASTGPLPEEKLLWRISYNPRLEASSRHRRGSSGARDGLGRATARCENGRVGPGRRNSRPWPFRERGVQPRQPVFAPLFERAAGACLANAIEQRGRGGGSCRAARTRGRGHGREDQPGWETLRHCFIRQDIARLAWHARTRPRFAGENSCGTAGLFRYPESPRHTHRDDLQGTGGRADL